MLLHQDSFSRINGSKLLDVVGTVPRRRVAAIPWLFRYTAQLESCVFKALLPSSSSFHGLASAQTLD